VFDGLIRAEADPYRSPFQGVIARKPYPGLKPWAIFLARFAFKHLATSSQYCSPSQQSPLTSHLSLLTFQ
jgi:hypothetical protein